MPYLGALPLSEKEQKIAVVGPNADSCYSLLGDYTWAGISEFFHRNPVSREKPHLVTLLEALQKRLGDQHVISYERGCDWDTSSGDIKENEGGDERGHQAKLLPLEKIPTTDSERAMEIAAQSDVIIAAMGENRYLCGECCDRKQVNLPGEQQSFVERLCDLKKPVILIIFGGRPLAIGKLAEKCAAVLYAWYPGEEGGNAVVDILTGAVNPSAKLTVTLPKTTEVVPLHYGMAENISEKYPFGFGLSYTEYAYQELKVPGTISVEDAYFDISFKIQNIGERDGVETAQVYLSGSDSRKKLIGFSRMELKKGEIRETVLRFYLDTFARYDSKGELFLEPEKWKLEVGASSEDIRLSAELTLAGERKKVDKKEHFSPSYDGRYEG